MYSILYIILNIFCRKITLYNYLNISMEYKRVILRIDWSFDKIVVSLTNDPDNYYYYYYYC